MNKIKVSLVFIISILLIGCSNIIENNKFDRIANKFMNQYFQFYPTQATFLGNHGYDDQVNNFSKENIDKLIQFLKLTTKKLGSIDTAKLHNKNKVNYKILVSQLKIQLFELEQRKKWQKDAAFYTQNIYDVIYGLQFHRNDTTDNRTRDLLSRLAQIPDLLDQAKKNLQFSDAANLNNAIEHIDNQKRMIAFQLATQFRISDMLVDSLNKKSEILVDSLESFKKFLESKSANSINGISNMTPELYQTYMNLIFNNKVNSDEIINFIETDYDQYYSEILDIAATYFSERKKLNDFTKNSNSIERLNDEIEKQSLTKDKIISFCYENIIKIKRFIDEIWNLTLPIDYNVQIDWTGGGQVTPMKLAEFEKFGLLGRRHQFYCFLKPILNDQDWIQQLSQLRDYNEPALKLIMMLEATPIHYQIWMRKLNDIPTFARAFPDQIFVNSWRYYFAFSLVDAGFEGYDPEMQFVLLRDFLRELMLAKIEIQYYLQQLTISQVERQLLDSKLFHKNETEEVIKRMHCSPLQALMIYWGVNQLKQLEEIYRKELGPYFSINDFFHNLLGSGPLPIEFIQQRAVDKLASKKAN